MRLAPSSTKRPLEVPTRIRRSRLISTPKKVTKRSQSLSVGQDTSLARGRQRARARQIFLVVVSKRDAKSQARKPGHVADAGAPSVCHTPERTRTPHQKWTSA